MFADWLGFLKLLTVVDEASCAVLLFIYGKQAPIARVTYYHGIKGDNSSELSLC